MYNGHRVSSSTFQRQLYSTDVHSTVPNSDTSKPIITLKTYEDTEVNIDVDNRRIDDIYTEYQERIANHQTITEQDFINIMNACKRSTSKWATNYLKLIIQNIQTHNSDNSSLIIRGYNMLLQKYINDKRWDEAMAQLEQLLSQTQFYSAITINTMINGSLKTSSTKNLHQLVSSLERHGYQLSDSNMDRLIKTCNIMGDPESAILYFNRAKAGLGKLDIQAYQCMIYVLKSNDRPDDALAIFQEMQDAGINPTVATYHILLEMLCKKGRTDEMEDLFEKFEQSGLQPNISIYLAMNWGVNKALQQLEKHAIPLQVRDYNTLIVQSISDNNMEEAISYFKSMEKAGIQANHVSYSILMDTLLKNDQTAQALEMYELMIESGVKPDTHTFNALLARHVINGDRNDCLEALDKLHDKGHSPDSRTANFLMSIILKEGKDVQKDCEFLIKLLYKLKEYRCSPNTKTYNMVLEGLSRFSYNSELPEIANGSFRGLQKGSKPQFLEVSAANVPDIMKTIYKEMRQSPIKFCKPDSRTYDLIIRLLLDISQEKAALRMYEDAKRSRMHLSDQLLVHIQKHLASSGMDMQIVQMFYDHRNKRYQIRDSEYYNLLLETCKRLGLDDTRQEVIKDLQAQGEPIVTAK
jgi:pentatricopeptide repeat protein